MKIMMKSGESIAPQLEDTFSFMGNKRLELNVNNVDNPGKSLKRLFKFDRVF